LTLASAEKRRWAAASEATQEAGGRGEKAGESGWDSVRDEGAVVVVLLVALDA
jgi:hypothetical protein